MAVKKHTPLDYAVANLGGAQFSIFICDTFAELPSGTAPNQFRKGDLAVTLDTPMRLWVATSTTTWRDITGGTGSSVSPATTVTNEQGFGLSPVVGAGPNYATEQHSHGSVGHDAHTNLTGVAADQHHADVHGSGKHTGGILSVQDEGAGGGLVATVNFVGAGVSAAVAGTVGTVTIPGSTATPTQFVAKTADESVTSSTTLQNDNELLIPMLANEVWRARGSLRFDNNGLSGASANLGMTVPAGCKVYWVDGIVSTTRFTEANALVYSLASNPAAGLYEAEPSYLIINGAAAGNFQLTWAQNVSNANPLFMRKYSTLVALRVA